MEFIWASLRNPPITSSQICSFLNLDNNSVTLGGSSLTDSTQDNGPFAPEFLFHAKASGCQTAGL